MVGWGEGGFLSSTYNQNTLLCFSGTYNQNIHVYDINTHQHIKALTGHFGTVTGLVLSVTGRLLFSASYDTTVQVKMLKMLPI